ncbi:MAG: hypothetical protein IJZ89_00795 [Clostridia bacterium]|nr:hypothetical protein [Clostridia bacterium]
MMYKKWDNTKEKCRPVFCRICGSAIMRDDFAMMFSGKAICSACISEISAREILRICEFSSKEDLLYSLGFTRI